MCGSIYYIMDPSEACVCLHLGLISLCDSDVVMGAMASQITDVSIVCSTVCSYVHTQIKENIKTPLHWFWDGNPRVNCGSPPKGPSNTENVSIWWRHHKMWLCCEICNFHAYFGDWCLQHFPRNHPDIHHDTYVTHVPWCMLGSLTSGFRWSRWRGNVPGMPGPCANPNFTYLVRDPLPEPIFTKVSVDQSSGSMG